MSDLKWISRGRDREYGGLSFLYQIFFSTFFLCYNRVNDSERSGWDSGKRFLAGGVLPTALGYISIGLACGVGGVSYLSPLEMALMSVLVYAGAAQFAMISLIASHLKKHLGLVCSLVLALGQVDHGNFQDICCRSLDWWVDIRSIKPRTLKLRELISGIVPTTLEERVST